MNIEALSTKRGYEKATEFLSCRNALLAIDESTTIKSPKAARTKNLTKLRKLAPYRRILTGSPVTKSPIDLYSQCEFLEEECLNQSSFGVFKIVTPKWLDAQLAHIVFIALWVIKT